MINRPTSERWVTNPTPNPQSRFRLFCFPYAGGGASIFRTWSEVLPAEVEIRPVQLPGREGRLREPPLTRISPLVEVLAGELLPYLDKPFAFFGHSMGAVVSFELARFLRRKHALTPAHLLVSERGAPQVSDPRRSLHDLPDVAILEELRRLNGTRPEVLAHEELMGLILPTLLADFELVETHAYMSEPPLACPITAFGGCEDQEVSLDNLQAWRHQTLASFSLHILPGDHFFLDTAPSFLLLLSQELRRLIRLTPGP